MTYIFYFLSIMPSKLALQLMKETPGKQQPPVDEDRLDDIYQIITKV